MKPKRKESGLRERRLSSFTGTTVSLWDANEAGLKTDNNNRWVTICEDHDESCSHRTLREAHNRMARCEWCPQCQRAAQYQRMSQDVCINCGREIVWFKEVTPPDEICIGYTTVLVTEDGNYAMGVTIEGQLYCTECAPAAIQDHCIRCRSGDRPPTSKTIATLRAAGILSPAEAEIEVVDLIDQPAPDHGTWMRAIYDRIREAHKRGESS